jgi:hypothetical protein
MTKPQGHVNAVHNIMPHFFRMLLIIFFHLRVFHVLSSFHAIRQNSVCIYCLSCFYHMNRHDFILTFKTASFHFCKESFFFSFESYGIVNLQSRFAFLRRNTRVRSSSPRETERLVWSHVCMSVTIPTPLNGLF